MSRAAILAVVLFFFIISPSWSYAAKHSVPSDLELTLTDLLKENARLNQKIKGIILWLVHNNSRIVAVDSPNVWGSVVKVGIPEPTGTIVINKNTLPGQSCMYFFASEIHNSVKTLSSGGRLLPYGLQNNKLVDGDLAKIREGLENLQKHNFLIHAYILGPYPPTKILYGVDSELVALAEDANNLQNVLKSSRKKAHAAGVPYTSLSVAGKNQKTNL